MTEQNLTPIRTKSPDDYKNHKLLDPKKESTKQEYMSMYEDYCMNGMLVKEIAEKWGHDPRHTCEILKWATHQLANIDNSTRLQGMCDKLRMRQRDLEKQIDNTQDKPKVQVIIYAELRKTDRLIAELQGMISNAVIDMSDRRQVKMEVSEVMQGRRKGVGGEQTEHSSDKGV